MPEVRALFSILQMSGDISRVKVIQDENFAKDARPKRSHGSYKVQNQRGSALQNSVLKPLAGQPDSCIVILLQQGQNFSDLSACRTFWTKKLAKSRAASAAV